MMSYALYIFGISSKLATDFLMVIIYTVSSLVVSHQRIKGINYDRYSWQVQNAQGLIIFVSHSFNFTVCHILNVKGSETIFYCV